MRLSEAGDDREFRRYHRVCYVAKCGAPAQATTPNSVVTIGDHAAREGPAMEQVTLANLLTTIGESSFRSYTSPQELTLPNSLVAISDHALRDAAPYRR